MLGQMLVRRGDIGDVGRTAAQAVRAGAAWPRSPMSSTGMTTSISSGLRDAGVDDGDLARACWAPTSRRGNGRPAESINSDGIGGKIVSRNIRNPDSQIAGLLDQPDDPVGHRLRLLQRGKLAVRSRPRSGPGVSVPLNLSMATMPVGR